MAVVEDTVTWYPAVPGRAATIVFVVRPVPPPALVRYTHLLPSATGNGIELAFTNGLAAAFWRAVAAGAAVVTGAPVVTGAAVDASDVAPLAVFPAAWPDTSGAVDVPTPVQPARAMRARPTRKARADRCLLM